MIITFILQVLPDLESIKLSGNGYTGMIKMNFWQFGKWTEVTIDDRLPVRVGGRGYYLILCRSDDPNEFWISLLEKAYAK